MTAIAEFPATLCVLLAPSVMSYELARLWGRDAFWNRYIVAFNWCQWLLPVIAFVLIVALVSGAGRRHRRTVGLRSCWCASPVTRCG